MAILVRVAREGGITRGGDIIVPAHLEEWAREVLRQATPPELEDLVEAIRGRSLSEEEA